MEELQKTVLVHQKEGSRLSGIHLESSGTQVTECLRGIKEPISYDDLKINYETQCDPRLSYTQSLELVEKFCQIYQQNSFNIETSHPPSSPVLHKVENDQGISFA